MGHEIIFVIQKVANPQKQITLISQKTLIANDHVRHSMPCHGFAWISRVSWLARGQCSPESDIPGAKTEEKAGIQPIFWDAGSKEIRGRSFVLVKV